MSEMIERIRALFVECQAIANRVRDLEYAVEALRKAGLPCTCGGDAHPYGRHVGACPRA
jgi:hypothetical protein